MQPKNRRPPCHRPSAPVLTFQAAGLPGASLAHQQRPNAPHTLILKKLCWPIVQSAHDGCKIAFTHVYRHPFSSLRMVQAFIYLLCNLGLLFQPWQYNYTVRQGRQSLRMHVARSSRQPTPLCHQIIGPHTGLELATSECTRFSATTNSRLVL